jgi:kynurenine formamidase
MQSLQQLLTKVSHYILVGAILAYSLLASSCSQAPTASAEKAPPQGSAGQPSNTATAATLDALVNDRLKVVDLSYILNDKTPYWPGKDYQPFKLTTIATIEKDGVLSKTIFMPEHLGTHIDAPNHFEKNQPAVHQIETQNLFARGVVIDVTLQAESNPDYQLQVADIEAWEKANGKIPDGAVVYLMTGWHRFWTNYDRYKNQDAMGQMHFPGYSAEAAKFLVEKRRVKGIGIDTLSIDPGTSKDFAVHHVVNGAGRYGLENVARLDELPAKGFYVIVAPLKIEDGTGGPCRIFAMVPSEASKS